MMENFRKFIREEFDVKEVKDPITENISREDRLNDLIHQTIIKGDEIYEKPPTYLGIVSSNGVVEDVCTPGNITAITGKAKSKKSFLRTLFTASASLNGKLQHRIVANLPEGKENILVFDTEQSKYHTYRSHDRVNRLCMRNNDNVATFSLRGLTANEIIELIEYTLDFFSNTGMIFIDQIADLASSINDEKEAVRVVRWLEKLSQEKQLSVVCVIHQNKDNNYASGWLGSQILKKAECVIDVQRDENNKDISHVKPAASRSKDFEQFSMRIDSYGLPEIISSDIVSQYIQQQQ